MYKTHTLKALFVSACAVAMLICTITLCGCSSLNSPFIGHWECIGYSTKGAYGLQTADKDDFQLDVNSDGTLQLSMFDGGTKTAKWESTEGSQSGWEESFSNSSMKQEGVFSFDMNGTWIAIVSSDNETGDIKLITFKQKDNDYILLYEKS